MPISIRRLKPSHQNDDASQPAPPEGEAYEALLPSGEQSRYFLQPSLGRPPVKRESGYAFCRRCPVLPSRPRLLLQPGAEATHLRPCLARIEQHIVPVRTAHDVLERLDQLALCDQRGEQDRRKQGHAGAVDRCGGVEFVRGIVVGVKAQVQMFGAGLAEPLRPILVREQRQRGKIGRLRQLDRGGQGRAEHRRGLDRHQRDRLETGPVAQAGAQRDVEGLPGAQLGGNVEPDRNRVRQPVIAGQPRRQPSPGKRRHDRHAQRFGADAAVADGSAH